MKDRPPIKLIAVKVIHTVAWAIFAGCILVLPVAVWQQNFDLAAVFAMLVLAETGILAANGMRCPLTDIAARFTDDRRDNFDIYLPLKLARHNKVIFGSLYIVGLLYAIARWIGWPG